MEEESYRRRPYPSSTANGIGVALMFIGFAGIGCAIGSNFIQLDIFECKKLFLYGGLAIGGSSLLTGIVAIISGKSKTGVCLMITLLIFALPSLAISAGLSYKLVEKLQFLNEAEENVVLKPINIVADNLLKDNPWTKSRQIGYIICIVLLVVGILEVLLTFMSICISFKGICCHCGSPSTIQYGRISYHYPAQSPVIITH